MKATNNIDVSIIIVNYNTCKLTLQCIQSVYDKTEGLEFEVILVDNNSSDNTIKCVRNKYSDVVIIENATNLGFGKANNIGYKYSKGDYIFLLNSDTVLVNNAVFELYSFMRNNSNIAIAGGRLENRQGEMVHSYSVVLPSLKSEWEGLLRSNWENKLQKKLDLEVERNSYGQIGYITGADMMLRRSLIEEVGMFDEDFFMYFEETEMTSRYDRKGLHSYYLPSARIIHLAGQSSSFKEKKQRMILESRKLYYVKTYSLFYYWVSSLLYFFYLMSSSANFCIKKDRESADCALKTAFLLLSI